jgi:hypothetical protein
VPGMLDKLYRSLMAVACLGLVLIAGWWTLFLRAKLSEHEAALAERDAQLREKDGTIGELRTENAAQAERVHALGLEVEAQARRIRSLEAALRLLKVDHRLARIEILSQDAAPDGAVTTRLRFTELDGEGAALDPGREADVHGRRVYVESLVIKFGDDYVEGGDFLRGTSICLFTRVFGEEQKPNDGAPLEVAGRRPRVYAGDEAPDPFYDDLWERFWEYANDPEAAKARGVRAIHGEAPFLEVAPGKRYLLELRASGGLSFRAE